MRVVHIIKVKAIAGAEHHLLALLGGLRARGVDARLIVLTEPRLPMDDYLKQLEAAEIPAERLIIPRHLSPAVFNQLRKKLRELRPDIVHTHLLHADLHGIPAAKLAGVKAVITTRHNDNAFRRRLPFRQVNALLWRLTRAGIVISDALKQFCIEVEHAPARKLHTIYYGLDLAPLDRNQAAAALRETVNAPREAWVFGIVCRLVEQKGVSYALQAFAKLAADHPQAQLIIAGDGPLRAALNLEAAALRIAERVHFLGWQEDTAPIMAGIDALLLPSLWEGFGLVLLEAMAQSTPIIASRVSAIPEIVIDGETGLLVPPRDVETLAAAMRTLITDSALARHMGLLGQARVEAHFSAARMVEQTLALYQQVI